MKLDFDKLTVEERRIILVCTDEKYQEIINQVDWRKVAKVAKVALAVSFPAATPLLFASSTLGRAVAASSYLTQTLIKATPAGATSNRSWWDKLKNGELPFPHLSPNEAVRRFRFDFGEPKNGNAYLLNPCTDDHYLIPAVASERLAQEKLAAFTQIAVALGAKTVEIISAEAAKNGASGSATFPIEEAAAQIGLSVTFDAAHKVHRQVLMELDDPKRQPYVPKELGRWADVDPLLRALINTRLTAHPRSARTSLAFEDTLDVKANAVAELAERKIGVGGTYRQLKASTWSFEITFWPTPS
jgi:hypothetical protein